MQRIKTTVAFLAGAGLAFGTSAVAGPGLGFEGPPFLHILRDLQLTDEQQALADELVTQVKQDHEEGKARREASFETIRTELGEAKPDSRALHGIIDDALARGSEIAHARLDDFLTFHASLSADQRGRLVDGLEEVRDLHHERMERMRDHHRGGVDEP